MKEILTRICIGCNWRRTLIRGALFVVVVIGLCSTIILPIRVRGDSMLPMYETGDRGFMNTLAYRWATPKRFDVIGIRMAGKEVMYLKRIIGLPGETVEFHDGVVHVNGEALAEPYLLFRGRWNLKKQSLSDDEYFVVGDNRDMPIHLHKFGKVKRRRIIGRMW